MPEPTDKTPKPEDTEVPEVVAHIDDEEEQPGCICFNGNLFEE